MNKKKKIIGVAAVLAVCLAIAIPVGRGKFNFDDKFKIAGNFKANSSKNDAENGESGDANNIDGNIGQIRAKIVFQMERIKIAIAQTEIMILVQISRIMEQIKIMSEIKTMSEEIPTVATKIQAEFQAMVV